MARKQYYIPKLIPQCFAILIIIIIITNGVQTEMESLYKTVCSHNKLVITCPYSHKIAIKRLYYGIKPNAVCNNQSLIRTERVLTTCCRAGPQDCIVLDDSQYSNYTIYCSGYRSCERKVAAVKSMSTCSKPNQETHYQQVVYHCVQESNIIPFCSSGKRRGKTVFVGNRGYPESISGGIHECQCQIYTGFGSGVTLHAVDITISTSSKLVCQKGLKISDINGEEIDIGCGYQGLYGFRTLYKKGANNLTVTLYSLSEDSRGYVWLQAKAVEKEDYVIVNCQADGVVVPQAKDEYPLVEKTDIFDSSGDNSGIGPTSSVATIREGKSGSNDGEEETKLTHLVYAIGGAAAAILLLLVLALVGVALYCQRAKRKKRRLSQLQKSSVFNPSKLENKQDPYNYNEDHYISIRRTPLRVSTYSTLQAVTKKKTPKCFDPRNSNQNSDLSNHYLNDFEMTNISEVTVDDPIGTLGRNSAKKPKYETYSCQEADILPGNSHYANITFSAPPIEQNTLRKSKTRFSSQTMADNEKLEFLPPPLESFMSDEDKDMYYSNSLNTPPISPMVVDNFDYSSSRQGGGYYKTPVIHPIYDTVSEDQQFLPSPTFQNDNYLIGENIATSEEDTTYDLNLENGNITEGSYLEPNHYKTPRRASNSNFIFPPPPSPTDFIEDLYNSNVYCEMQLGSNKNDNSN